MIAALSKRENDNITLTNDVRCCSRVRTVDTNCNTKTCLSALTRLVKIQASTRRSLGPQLVLLLQRSVAFRKQWSPSRRSDHLKKTSSRAAFAAGVRPMGRHPVLISRSARVRVHTCQSHRLWPPHLLFPTSIASLFSDPAAHATPARRPPPSRLGTH